MKNHINWEFFLTGTLDNDPLPKISMLRRIEAFRQALYVYFILRMKGWNQARQYLERPRRFLALSEEGAISLAYQELIWPMLIVRCFDPQVLCLTKSVVVTSYLLTLGLPVHLVIGRALLLSNDKYNFHAWVELFTTVISNAEDIQQGYKPLYRLLPLYAV